MDWDRRTFVKFAVGAAMGVGASPLLPKLTDDIAIWTQNWSWVPNPENGAVAFAHTVNPATGTGVKVRAVKGRIKGKRLIRVEGNPEHPLSRGGVVPADASALQLLYYDKLRVPGPMMREPRTGAPRQVKAETALAYVAEKLAALKKAGKAHTVAVVGDHMNSVSSEILARMFLAYGSPNVVFEPDADQTLSLAGTLMMGHGEIGFDLDHADCIISFGTPLLEGFGAPVAVRKAFARLREAKGRTLIQVEPRASVTASQADIWLACKPGTEAAVALGICHLLVKNGAYDKALEDGAAFGFDDLPGHDGFKSLILKKYTPEKVFRISGVPADQLKKAAQVFVKTKRAVAVCGPDGSGSPGRLFDFMSVLALNALKGNLGRPGGVVARPPLALRPLGEALDLPKAPPVDEGAVRALAMDNLHALAQGALSGKPYKIEALVLVGCNPLFTGPQANIMREFLESVPFVVAITPFMDETASLADVVLPAATFLEGWGDCTTPYGGAVPAYGLHRPLIKAAGGAQSASDWLLKLAKGLGGAAAEAVPFKDAQEALKSRTKKIGDFKKLAEKSYWVADKVAYGPIKYETTSGRFEFFSMALHERVVKVAKNVSGGDKLLSKLGVMEKGAAAFMPHYEPPEALAKVGKDYPLLMAAVPSLRTTGGNEPNSPYMIKILSDDTLARKNWLVVEINPKTAAKLGLSEKDPVEIASPAGKIKALVHIFAGAAPDMVFVPVGLGHSAFDMYLRDRGDNFFKAACVRTDAMSGLPQWELSPVKVRKVRG